MTPSEKRQKMRDMKKVLISLFLIFAVNAFASVSFDFIGTADIYKKTHNGDVNVYKLKTTENFNGVEFDISFSYSEDEYPPEIYIAPFGTPAKSPNETNKWSNPFFCLNMRSDGNWSISIEKTYAKIDAEGNIYYTNKTVQNCNKFANIERADMITFQLYFFDDSSRLTVKCGDEVIAIDDFYIASELDFHMAINDISRLKTFKTLPIPEPAEWAFASGLFALIFCHCRKKTK